MDDKRMAYPLLLTLEELEEVAQLLPKDSTAKEKAVALYGMAEALERADRLENQYKSIIDCAAIDIYELD